MISRLGNPHRLPRDAFTLVEVLVVIGIIALLTTLLVIAIGPSLENAKINATKATIAQINEIVQQRVDALNRLNVSSEAKKLAALNLAGAFSGLTQKQAEERAEFLIRSILYRQALPQRPEDLKGIDQSSTADDAPLYAIWTGTGENSGNTNVVDPEDTTTVSSAILYLALTRGATVQAIPGGKSYPVPILDTSSINPRHIQQYDFDKDADDPSTTNVVENENAKTLFRDEWGAPLRFYRTPTSLIRKGGSGNSITNSSIAEASLMIGGLPNNTSDNGLLGTDPLDPIGTLYSVFQSSFTLNYATSGSPLNGSPFSEQFYRTPKTYYVPLLVSCGPDGACGLGEPNDNTTDYYVRHAQVTSFSDMTDNVTNRQ